MKRPYFAAVLLAALFLSCTNPATRVAVPDIDIQRDRISDAIGMIDGLDETATPAAISYAHQLVRSELISADRMIFDLQSKLRACAIQHEDVMQAYDSCMASKKDLESDYYDLKKEGGWLARIGLRWTWFFYGVGATLILLIVGGIVLYFTGWTARITAAVGGFRL